MKIKAVIVHYDKPENADKLFEQLSTVFTTELWDCGSPSHRIPQHVTHPLANIYMGGAWNRAKERAMKAAKIVDEVAEYSY